MCALAKITKTHLSRLARTQAEEKPEIIFTDVTGPFRVKLLSGFPFYIVFAELCVKFLFLGLPKAKIKALVSLKKIFL